LSFDFSSCLVVKPVVAVAATAPVVSYYSDSLVVEIDAGTIARGFLGHIIVKVDVFYA
jgi:hypothetical protein